MAMQKIAFALARLDQTMATAVHPAITNNAIPSTQKNGAIRSQKIKEEHTPPIFQPQSGAICQSLTAKTIAQAYGRLVIGREMELILWKATRSFIHHSTGVALRKCGAVVAKLAQMLQDCARDIAADGRWPSGKSERERLGNADTSTTYSIGI